MKKLLLFITIATLYVAAYSQNGICMIIKQGGETIYQDAQVDWTVINDTEHVMYISIGNRNYTFNYTITDVSKTDKYTYCYTSDGSVLGINNDIYAEYKYLFRVFTTINGVPCELFILFNK